MRTLILPLAALLGGCACFQKPEPEIKVVDTACTWTAPIYVSHMDVLTNLTAEAIWTHNETGREKCGWNRRQP